MKKLSLSILFFCVLAQAQLPFFFPPVATTPSVEYFTNGIVYWSKLNDAAGTNVLDSGPFGYSGNLPNSPTWGASWLTLNGANQYGKVTANLLPAVNAASNFSATAWCYFTNYPNTRCEITLLPALESGDFAADIFLGSDNKLTLNASVGGVANLTASQATTVLTNQWVFVAGTWSGVSNQATLYVNGVQAAQLTYEAAELVANSADTNLWSFGAYIFAGSPGGNLLGALDDVRLYNRVLDLTTEIAPMFTDGRR